MFFKQNYLFKKFKLIVIIVIKTKDILIKKCKREDCEQSMQNKSSLFFITKA